MKIKLVHLKRTHSEQLNIKKGNAMSWSQANWPHIFGLPAHFCPPLNSSNSSPPKQSKWLKWWTSLSSNWLIADFFNQKEMKNKEGPLSFSSPNNFLISKIKFKAFLLPKISQSKIKGILYRQPSPTRPHPFFPRLPYPLLFHFTNSLIYAADLE